MSPTRPPCMSLDVIFTQLERAWCSCGDAMPARTLLQATEVSFVPKHTPPFPRSHGSRVHRSPAKLEEGHCKLAAQGTTTLASRAMHDCRTDGHRAVLSSPSPSPLLLRAPLCLRHHGHPIQSMAPGQSSNQTPQNFISTVVAVLVLG